MIELLTDITLVAVIIIGITAFLAVIVNGIGTTLFGRNESDKFTNKSESIQSGWKAIGGTKK